MIRTKAHRKIRAGLDANGVKPALTAVEARFAGAQARLGPNRQQLIRNILSHCEETCFLSSR